MPITPHIPDKPRREEVPDIDDIVDRIIGDDPDTVVD